MPKKKSNSRKTREKNFNAANEFLNTSLQTVQSTSLLPYVEDSSEFNYLRNIGFLVYDSPITLMQNITVPSQQAALYNPNPIPYDSVAFTQSIVPGHSIDNQISPSSTTLFKETFIPCEMSWEIEPNNTFPTLILQTTFRPQLPFEEKNYDFPCFSGEEGQLLASPITTKDPFVMQHYKCAMEWHQLLATSLFPHTLLHKDISYLVTYQITYNSLRQIFDVLHIYLSMSQKDTKTGISLCIENYSDRFSTLDKPSDLFRKGIIKIKQQLESLQEINLGFNMILMSEGLHQTAIRQTDSFHRVSSDLILFISNGSYSDPETRCFTGLLSWLYSLLLLPNIALLTRYTAETSEQTGRFLKPEYTTQFLEFTPSKINTIPKGRGILTEFIRKKLDERAKNNEDSCRLPNLKPSVILTIDKEAVDPLILNINTDLAAQLFNYLKSSSKPFASPFSFYCSSIFTSTAIDLIEFIFHRLAAVTDYCVNYIVLPAIHCAMADTTHKKRLTYTELHTLDITIGEHLFRIYPNYLLGDNYVLIRGALHVQLKILILDHLTQNANNHTIFPKVSQSFFSLIKSYCQNYLTLFTTLETCTRRARLDFITRHNAKLTSKAAQIEKELLTQEEKKNTVHITKKNKSSKKILQPPMVKEISSEIPVSERSKIETPCFTMEDKLQKQLDQLQNQINGFTGGNNQLSELPTVHEKISYLFMCINSFKKLLEEEKKQAVSNNEKIISYTLKTVLRVEIFYYFGLLLPYQATRFFREKNINNFNPVITTLKTLKKTLETLSLLYAFILTEQDSMPKANPYINKLQILLEYITFVVSYTEENIKQVENKLQQDLELSLQKPNASQPLTTYSIPLYIRVPDFRSLPGFFNVKRAISDFKQVSTEFLDYSANIHNKLMKSNKIKTQYCSPRFPQSYLFTPESTADKVTPNLNTDDTASCSNTLQASN